MEKNIYDLLNEVEIDIESYPAKEMNDLEKARILKDKSLKNNLFKAGNITMKNTNKSNYKKYIGVASFAIASTIAIGSIPVLASMNPTAYSIASALGINKDLGDYTTVVKSPITKDGVTVELSEVIYDRPNQKLIISTAISSEDGVIGDTHWAPHTRIYINGEEINTASSSKITQIDTDTMGIVSEHLLPQDYTGDMNMLIHYAGVEVNDEYVKKTWKFEFTTNGDELEGDTLNIPLDQTFTLQDGEKVTLTNYTQNVLFENIFYTVETSVSDKLLEIRGTDSLGNPVVFSLKHSTFTDGGEFRLDQEESTLSPDATSMTLQLYSLDLPEENGPITSEYEAVGEAFTVELN